MKKRGFQMVFLWILALAAFGAVLMLLWNLLVPGIFGLTTINFWQALGLLALSRILFGGFGRGKMMGGGFHGKGHNPIHDKWMKMTPEQRKEFISRRRKFGFGGPFGRDNFWERDDFNRGDTKDSEKGNE